MTLRIDVQSHVFPKAYAELLIRNTNSLRTTCDGDTYLINYGDVQRFKLNLDDYSLANKLRAMDEARIDLSVLSVNIPGPELLDPELSLTGSRICNDYLAEICARYPERFVGLASLPLNDVAAAITELDRALDELDLRGVFLFSHINGKPLDAPEFEPFYAHVAARGVPLVLHPTVPTWGTAIQGPQYDPHDRLHGGYLNRHVAIDPGWYAGTASHIASRASSCRWGPTLPHGTHRGTDRGQTAWGATIYLRLLENTIESKFTWTWFRRRHLRWTMPIGSLGLTACCLAAIIPG